MKTKENLLKWYDKEYCLQVVKQTGLSLQFVKNPTEEICLAAIKQNKDAIDFVDIKKFPKVYKKYLSMYN